MTLSPEQINLLVEENKLLRDVLGCATATLFISVKGTPEELGPSLGRLSIACRAHWNWKTERFAAESEARRLLVGEGEKDALP